MTFTITVQPDHVGCDDPESENTCWVWWKELAE